MAINEVFKEADSLDYAVNSAVVAGNFVVIGGIVGVAETSAKVATDGSYYATLRHKGVFTGTTSEAVSVGDAIYLASAATYGTALTKTSSGNKLVGYAVRAKGATAGAVHVRINN